MKIRLYYLVFLLFACNSDSLIECEPEEHGIKKVLVIGIDGLRSDGFNIANTLAMDKILDNAKYTFTNRIDSLHPVTAPNWASILTGVWFEKHLVKDNTYFRTNFEEFPSFLERAKKIDQTLSVHSFSASVKINKYIIDNISGEFPHGDAQNQKDDDVHRELMKELKSCTTFDIGFVHYLNVDKAGHKYGFSPTETNYLDAISCIDDFVSEIFDAIQERDSIHHENWMIVIATDHGGVKVEEAMENENTGQHANFGKNTNVKHVPLIFYNADFERAQIQKNTFVVDVVPTILNFLEIENNEEWDLDGEQIEL